jgi:hypothetical protein
LTYFLNSGTPDGLSQTNISPGLSYFSGKTHLSHPRSFAPASGLNEYQQVLPPTQEETVLDANGRKQKMTSVNYPATPATQYYTSKPSKKYPTSGNKAYVYVHPTQQHAVPLTMNNFSSFHNTKQRAPPNLAHTSFSPSGLVTERGQMLPPPPRLPLSNSTDNMENLSQSFTGLGHQQQPSDSRIRSGIRNSAQPQPLTDADKDHLKWIKQLNNLAVENRKGQSPQIGKSLPERGAVPQFPQFAQPKQKSDTKPAAPLYSSGEKGPTQYVISQPHLLGLRSSYNANTPSPQRQINESPSVAGFPGSASSIGNGWGQESEASTLTTVENDERRARRLARNRESARQSRRRKKENLSFLGNKVDKLYGEIEEERRTRIVTMEHALAEDERTRLEELGNRRQCESQSSLDMNAAQQDLKSAFFASANDMLLRREVAGFQNRTVRRQLLPYYHQFLLWTTCQEEIFFTAAKELKPKANGRMSSKQIGEELTNSEKPASKTMTSTTNDLPRFWPLICFELQFSADQEDRFKAAHATIKARDKELLASDRARVAAALALTIKLKEGIQGYNDAIRNRREKALLSVMSPTQTIAYLQWLKANRGRCSRLSSIQASRRRLDSANEVSLNELCDQLEKALKIQSDRRVSLKME